MAEFGLNVPQEVLDEFDETWQNEGLESRSRAVREAIQEYIDAHES
ncbi:ribbon-helix-helix protein, CopG family [Halococcus sp. PRR34]|nr:ribbon-helix-helix protein, CopG family [Halococcus sp. PRR34]